MAEYTPHWADVAQEIVDDRWPNVDDEAHRELLDAHRDVAERILALFAGAIREAKADAWDELYSTAYSDTGHSVTDPNNPYRDA